MDRPWDFDDSHGNSSRPQTKPVRGDEPFAMGFCWCWWGIRLWPFKKWSPGNMTITSSPIFSVHFWGGWAVRCPKPQRNPRCTQTTREMMINHGPKRTNRNYVENVDIGKELAWVKKKQFKLRYTRDVSRVSEWYLLLGSTLWNKSRLARGAWFLSPSVSCHLFKYKF